MNHHIDLVKGQWAIRDLNLGIAGRASRLQPKGEPLVVGRRASEHFLTSSKEGEECHLLSFEILPYIAHMELAAYLLPVEALLGQPHYLQEPVVHAQVVLVVLCFPEVSDDWFDFRGL